MILIFNFNTEQDSHPTYKRLLGSMQLVELLSKLKDDLTDTFVGPS